MEDRNECYKCNFLEKCNQYVQYDSQYCKEHRKRAVSNAKNKIFIKGKNMFVLIVIVFIFISLIAIFGDYKSKELEKDYRKFEETISEKI